MPGLWKYVQTLRLLREYTLISLDRDSWGNPFAIVDDEFSSTGMAQLFVAGQRFPYSDREAQQCGTVGFSL